MEAVKENMIALNKKLKQGNIQEMAVHAESIAAFATVMPPLFKDPLKDSYPEESGSFFKGAPPDRFEKASEQLRAAAMGLKTVTEEGNPDRTKTAVGSLGGSCGACLRNKRRTTQHAPRLSSAYAQR